jgi:hypothetical protein
MLARQPAQGKKQAKKRSLYGINEHFEIVFNAAMATQVIFQRLLRKKSEYRGT